MTSKRRKLPKNIVEKPSAEVAEQVFGKRLKRALDKVAAPFTQSHKDSVSDNPKCVK